MNKYEHDVEEKIIDRYTFYERERETYNFIATNETMQYADIILEEDVWYRE
ncbi:MAG: RbsD/FucU domain-containing protein [Sphaerochaetaceae bacterium]|nr:RbsD/FucU domain-containing protein [Sphaerochaetaceae bacterium]